MARRTNATSNEKQLPSIANRGYFSDYFLGYRLDAGLDELYKRWDAAERIGDPTARTRVRSLSTAFDKHRAEAANTAPDLADNDTRLALGTLHTDDVAALTDLNDAILTALGWTPTRRDTVTLTSGDKVVHAPVAHRCDTATGLLLVALDTVFATDPATVVADKTAAPGTLLHPVRLGDKPEGRTALEAAQLIFTADDAPTYILICSGGSITLLDRDRWGEGVHLGANLDDAVARGDNRARGELAAIAALFSADAINPGDQAQSVLTGLVDRAANESAGVSKDLRHGVRRSVEILANAVVHDVRHRQKGAWQQIDPDDLTRQCLRYLYRIIVLLYAEARPELGILPVDDPDYQSGYSVARLRDTALVELHSDHARNATHLQRSLRVLFTLVNDGYESDATLDTDARALTFPGLDSILFAETACPLLDRARLTDHTLQQVLAHLCFAKEQRGRARQSVSYATLGINQIGAVYEGLMAYRGFLATEELYELDSDGDPDTGTWVIPATRADEFSEEVFSTEDGPDGQPRRVRYSEGDFVFRLAGRDRQRSASYYSPEVLTEFTVRHTLDTYWDEHDGLTAGDILRLTVCEPALGSGAFLNEAINQLAARYLKATQDERGETIDPDRYQLELQKAKAHFAVNQAYGVDLNPTAVELAEVSLWLSSMHPGLRAPRFGARLRRGNSLIGARRATYTPDQAKRRPWTSNAGSPAKPPTDQPLHAVPLGEAPGIHHFLLPGEGWGVAADATELKGKGGKRPEPGLAESWAEAVRNWRRSVQAAPTRTQLDRLAALARRVEAAWATAAKDVAQHLRAHMRTIGVWGADPASLPAPGIASSTAFENPEGPTDRLRLLMDAWCALWMWAPANGTDLPTLDRWLDAGELLLGQPDAADTGSLFTAHDLDDGTLDSVERFGRATVAEVLERHPWLRECKTIARAQEFFHWELEHAPIFQAGGFDLQLGNPPWVRPTWDEPSVLGEADAWWAVTNLTHVPESEKRARRERLLERAHCAAAYMRDLVQVQGVTALLSAHTMEPELQGTQLNLYTAFMTSAWRRTASDGAVGLLHPLAHLHDPRAVRLRSASYSRLRRMWQFRNALFLFSEVHDAAEFGVNVYGPPGEVSFEQASNLLMPGTLDRSISHDGQGELPGILLVGGGWDLRPHSARVIRVNQEVLSTWASLLDEPETPWRHARLAHPLTQRDLEALRQFANQPARVGGLNRYWASGFHEKGGKDDGTFAWRPQVPSTLGACVLQGPHIANGNPLFSQPRPDCRHRNDWDRIYLGAIDDDFVPRTIYQKRVSDQTFLERQTSWNGRAYSSYFREAHREFVFSGNARTLQACLLPPGPAHLNTINSTFVDSNRHTAILAGLLSTLPYDYLVKTAGVGHITKNVLDSLPLPDFESPLTEKILVRTLKLNCLLRDYAPIWAELFTDEWQEDHFLGTQSALDFGSVGPAWSPSTPLFSEASRWLALCEMDAIAARMLGFSEDVLSQMYRSQFGVLRRNEASMVFDAAGRQVSGVHHAVGAWQADWEASARGDGNRPSPGLWERVQAFVNGDIDIDLGPLQPPFMPADREGAMRAAFRSLVQDCDAAS
jgi:hypothetical protein